MEPFEGLDFYDVESLLTAEEIMVRDMVRAWVESIRTSARSSDWIRHGMTYAAVLLGMVSSGVLAMRVIGPPEDAEAVRVVDSRGDGRGEPAASHGCRGDVGGEGKATRGGGRATRNKEEGVLGEEGRGGCRGEWQGMTALACGGAPRSARCDVDGYDDAVDDVRARLGAVGVGGEEDGECFLA